MVAKSVRPWFVLFICLAAFVSTTCGSSTSPTAPTPSEPAPTPAPPPPPPSPPATASAQVSVTPEPVPFSGQPITDAAGCAGSANTWFYDEIIKETGGAAITFTEEVDMFDGRTVNNKTGLNISVPALGSTTFKRRWCSATAAAHTAQATFRGTDANGHAISVTGPVVRLMAPAGK